MSRQPIALALTFLMIWSPFTSAGCGRSSAPASGTPPGPQLAAAQSAPASGSTAASPIATPPTDDETIALVRETTRKVLPPSGKSSFDAGAQAEALGADVTRLFAFVRDSVRDEIYAGVLRGARGALISHAANSWDKAALLAAMLRRHGRDVRFAHGRLAPDRAHALVARMIQQAGQPAVSGNVDASDAIAARSRDVLTAIETRWRTARSRLTDALDRAGVTIGQQEMPSEAVLAEEAADHAWVEYRDGDRWIPLDPSATAQPGEAATQATETFADIPDALYHHVTFRIIVEQRQNRKLEEHEAFVWSSTAAVLHGANVILTHEIGQTPLGRWRATPVLVVDQHGYAALSYTDGGVEAAAKVSDALVGEASRQVQGVAKLNELFGAPAPPPEHAKAAASELTGVRLEVEFADPSGRTETVRRDLLDRIGRAARARGGADASPLEPLGDSVPAALAGIYACAVTAGPLDPRIVTDGLAASLPALEDVTAIRKAVDRRVQPAEAPVRLTRMMQALPGMLMATAQSVHLLSQQLARRIQAKGTAVVFYEATPRLAIVSLDPGGSGFAVDLRRNALRAAAVGLRGPDLARANLERGVLDGVIEDAVARQVMATVSNSSPVSTLAILDRADADGAGFVVAADSKAVAALKVSDALRARLADAIAQRQLVVVSPPPGAPPAGKARAAWWQIDPRSGETVGVLDNGLHGAQLGERGAELQISRAGARAMMKDGFSAVDVANAYKAGLAAGRAGIPGAAQTAMAQGLMMGIGITLAIVGYIVVGILIGRASK